MSVMTMSRRSSLSISRAVITPTHMELSIRRLLHTGTQTTQQRERVRARDSGTARGEGKTRIFRPPRTTRPLAAPISSMRTVSFNYSAGAAIPQFTGKCHGAAVEPRFAKLFFCLWISRNFYVYCMYTICTLESVLSTVYSVIVYIFCICQVLKMN